MQAIDLRFALRMALMRLGDYARIVALLQDIVALAEARQDQQRLGLAYRHLIDYRLNTGALVRTLDVGQRALVLATRLDDGALQLSTRYVLARVYGKCGDWLPLLVPGCTVQLDL